LQTRDMTFVKPSSANILRAKTRLAASMERFVATVGDLAQ
jgi:hypothetical protein